MKEFEVIGYDAGYSHIKIVAGKEDRRLFPSMYAEYRPSRLGNYDTEPKFSEKNMLIDYEGDKIYIGASAIKHDKRNEGKTNFKDDKHEDKTEFAKFLAGISLFSQDKHIEIKRLMLGLSVVNFKENQPGLKEKYENKTFRFRLPGEKEENVVKVNQVQIIPQGIGAYWNEILDFNGVPKEEYNVPEIRYGVVDIGGRTVDIFMAEGNSVVRGFEDGFVLGVDTAFENLELQTGLPAVKIRNAFIDNSREVIHKGKHKLGEELDLEMKALANRIADAIDNSWDEALDSIVNIYICGGGAIELANYLNPLFEHQKVTTFSDPQFGNALGYYKVGKHLKFVELQQDNKVG